MQQFRFAPGDTSKSIDVFLPDSSSTTGAGLAALVFNTSNLKAYYRNTATGTVTAITLATQTVGGAWSSGGFVELDATNAKGMYRLDIPNAVLTSAGEGFVHIYGATNLAQTPVQISVGYQGVNIVQAAGTAVTLDSNNVLNVSTKYVGGTLQTARDLGLSVLLSAGSGTGQLDFTSGVVKANATQLLGTAWLAPGTAGTPDVNTKLAGGTAWNSGAITSSTIATDAITSTGLASSAVTEIQSGLSTLTGASAATAIWTDTTASDFTTALSIGKSVLNGVTLGTGLTINSYTGNTVQTGDSYARIGAPAGTSIAADLAEIEADTDTLTTDTASILSRIGAFTGSGVNTILGFFKALMKKDASNPSDLGGTFDAVHASNQAAADLAEADLYVDVGTTPWAVVYMLKGTGGIGAGTELLRKKLKDVNGSDLTATTTVVGESIQ